MYSKKQVEEIALNKIEEGKINKTVIVEEEEFPISIDFSQELANENQEPSLQISVGNDEDEYGRLQLKSGYSASLETPYGKLSISDEGAKIEADFISNTAGTHEIIATNANDQQGNLKLHGAVLTDITSGGQSYQADGTVNISAADDHGSSIGSIIVSIYGVTINPDADGTGQGYLVLEELPTNDPEVTGALWNDNGTLKISAGE